MKTTDDIVYDFKTKHEEGYTGEDILSLLKTYFPEIEVSDFYSKLGINTGMMIGGEGITYHTDVARTIRMITEDRDMYLYEWD